MSMEIRRKSHSLFWASLGILLWLTLVLHSGAQNGTATSGQSSTLLCDGRMLLTGGYGSDEKPTSYASILDPATGGIYKIRSGLNQARAGHSATMLPNGKVLIFGGVDAGGQILSSAEIFDSSNQAFSFVPEAHFLPRAFHTATLLTDGQVLIIGGISTAGNLPDDFQLWNSQSGKIETFHGLLGIPRQGHTATLLSTGDVFISGGKDRFGMLAPMSELYDRDVHRFLQVQAATENPSDALLPPRVAESSPPDGGTGVRIQALIAIRFSKLMRVQSFNRINVVLRSDQEAIETTVAAAESGRLGFVTPTAPLRMGTKYTVTLSNLKDSAGAELLETIINFQTEGDTFNSAEEEWIPDAENLKGKWRTARGHSEWQDLPPLQAPPGVTAIAGQILKLNGGPLENVVLAIDGATTKSDRTGRFLVTGVMAGRHKLVVDGRSADHLESTYGLYEILLEIKAGKTNVLPYPIWMTRLDTAHATKIPSPTTAEFVVTTPRLPGLELHIPPNTVITDHEGKPVHEISITAIPLDRPPFPLPLDVRIPIYFTIQPGGAYIDVRTQGAVKGARLFYPNTYDAKPGTRYDFWNYDPEGRGWYVYGQGTVSSDGRNIIPDTGVVLYEFTGAMVGVPSTAPAVGPPAGNNTKDGEPVDLSTGLFVMTKTDLAVPDVIPIALTRTYRQSDNRSRPFGIGATHPYEMFTVGDIHPWTYQELILPDGSRIHYNRVSPGTGYGDAAYTHNSTPTLYYGSTILYDGTRAVWHLRMKDGTQYTFPDAEGFNDPYRQALIGLTDRYGNKLTFTRDASGRLTKINSPSGRYIEFVYDAASHISSATDNIGRTVTYTYDGGGRLSSVTDANGGVTNYTYDSLNQMTSIRDARGIVYLTNEYDGNGRVIRQTQADGSVFQFAYTLDGNGAVTQTDVTDPRGYVRRVTFNSNGYTMSDTYALGQPEQRSTTYERSPDNLITQITDALGRQTAFTYDSMGNTTSITRLAGTPDAVTTSFTYEPNFNRFASITDPLNHTTTFAYDSVGNLITSTDPLGHSVISTYNSAGQPLTVTDALNNSVHFTYFGGDLASTTDPLGHTTTRFVDNAGRLVSTTDALAQTTKYQFNNLNQITQITDALGNQTSFSYDPNGNLLSVSDARGSITSYAYDNMDRPSTRTDPLNRVDRYQYDLAGNLAADTDRKGEITSYSYDPVNRRSLTGFQTVVNGGQPTYESTIRYSYDAGNRLTQIVDSTSGTITRTYDNLDRLTRETTPQGAISYGYDAAGRRTNMTVGGQPTVAYSYDDGDRLAQITQGASSVGFTYDDANRRSTLTLPNGISAEYAYDAAAQITGITYKLGANVVGDLTYGYDGAGRRTRMGGSLARTGLPQALASAAYNAANQLTQWGSTNFAYDGNGNLVSDGVNAYTWNVRNQLTSISGGTTASFQYDGEGRRIARGGTAFFYDGVNPVQELSSGVPVANLVTGLGIDEFFTRTDSSGAAHILRDALGSTLALADSTGALQTQYTYEPFGNTTSSGPTSSNTFQYTGRENDGTGLYYYRARYYNPTTGRFITEDPLGFVSGLNLYSYVGGSPMSFVDPSGLDKNPSNNAPPCTPIDSLNWLQKAQLTAAQTYANLTGWTVGFGVGTDVGAGLGPKGSKWNFGVGGSASTLIVADASGNSGFFNSASGGFAFVKMTSAGSWWGAGFAAGPSVLVSPFPISKIKGPSGSFSAGGGAVLGAGVSITTSGAATFTFGVAAGAEAGLSPQGGTSQFIPFCHD